MTGDAAIIIGIDAYETSPLTSAVNDAWLFRDALLDLGVADSGIRMLTAPLTGHGDLPTRKGILDALYPYYSGEKSVDRLFFFYAGHGLLAFADAGRALPRTAIVPVDVRDLARDGDTLIDLSSVLDRLRFSGPAEQFFFIDACRDLAYEEHPDATTALGWSRMDPGPERSQAILYAVPPLGRAQGERDGLGVMTRHLVDALHGRGSALDYSDDLRKYVVSPESVAAYVQKHVAETVGTVPLWQRSYILPRLDHREPKTGPIREIDQPPPASLTLHVQPQAAESATSVRLTQLETSVYRWPPNPYGQPFTVMPRRYWLEAKSEAGIAEPAQQRIDAREQHEATINIRQPSELPPGLIAPTEPGPSVPGLETTRDRTSYIVAPPPGGTVRAEALEQQATIELDQLAPPYLHWDSAHRLDEAVPPGTYRIRFRLGRDVYSESEIDVGNRAVVRVTPTIGASPLVEQILGLTGSPTEVTLSDQIGPIQGNVLATALPVIGIKPFDLTGQLFGRFDVAVPPIDPEALGMRPVSLVIAVDGNQWPADPGEVLGSMRATAGTGQPVDFAFTRILDHFGAGRIALGVIAAPETSFTINVESPYTGLITLAAASLYRRATVVTLTFRPDGSFDLRQNLLRIPGLAYDELVTGIPYERMLRDLQLGQSLYESGELLGRLDTSPLLTELLYAKWTDPILSCMAAFALADAGLAGENLLAATAGNLRHYFADLPDTRIVQAMAFPAQREEALAELLSGNELPVLARSAAELARYASEHHRDGPAVSLSRRVVPGQPWLMSWQAEAIRAETRALAAT